MSWRDAAGLVAGVMGLLVFVPYVVTCLRGTTRPNRASWWIWSLVGTLTLVTYYSAGARASAWVAVSYVVGPLVVAVVSVWKGEGGWTRFDASCLVLALGGAVVWWVTGDPVLALTILVGIDLLGLLPTVRKTWRDPSSESVAPWLLWLVADVVNLFAIDTWDFAQAFYPLYLTGFSVLMSLLASRPVPASPAGGTYPPRSDRAKVTRRQGRTTREAQMAHMSQLFIGHYAAAADASADYDSVAATHDSGATGHIEVAVVSRDAAGEVTFERHARLGGMHLGSSPTNEMQAGTQEVERGTVVLLVVCADDDLKAVDAAVTRAGVRASHPVDHAYGSGSDYGVGQAGSGSEGRLG